MQKSPKRIFIVGDTFAGAATQFDNIMIETDALDFVLSTTELTQPTVFLVQQGVDYRSLNSAVNAQNDSLVGEHLFFIDAGRSRARATKRLAHKARSENILISAPRQLDDHHFEMDLCFSAQNEFFLDHMTGMHIQGMALVESGRQAFLAVTEAFFLNEDSRDYYFVIKSIDTSFQNFVFPFDAILNYEVTSIRQKATRLGIDATITVIQAGEVCTTMNVAFTAFDANMIAEREREVATTCLEALGKSYNETAKQLENVA